MMGIRSLFRNLFTSRLNMPSLGRWKLEYGESMFRRIDQANMDHCGTCDYNDFLEKSTQGRRKKEKRKIRIRFL